ncbi:UDP-glucuronic acid decarboxylase family protein [Cohaesibacter haloalkalitolerans]|uniref:UDP-glucuronic acid decarboxylase family protein n=1 Tax=Cohaesibacter haloalkalitolerans TaxID=1162980 RepID=UPI000E65D600|nr:UDP-glucuronic acid decarboxylase family protein [Cohaesibacter haloalkalitolerans]
MHNLKHSGAYSRLENGKVRRKFSKTILVAGGAGFVGTHLCKRLLDAGNKVICVDSLMTGRQSNIQSFVGDENFRFVLHDIIKPLKISKPIDEIYNLACPASPPHYQADPVHTMQTCILGSINLLRLARKKGAKILLASTSEVYGDPKVHPQPENYWGNVNTVGPRSCYDEGKRCAETLFHDYAERDGIEVKIARIFNTYGPLMRPDDGRVVSNFICQALQGLPLTVYGDGQQTRSFCYVDDLVSGLVALMAIGKEVCDPVNLGNPGEFTVMELACLVREMTSSRSRIEHLPLPKDDPVVRRPSITRANRLLGWQPTIPLREGLEKTVAYFAAEIFANEPIVEVAE